MIVTSLVIPSEYMYLNYLNGKIEAIEQYFGS
jgi:hypothetical protein